MIHYFLEVPMFIITLLALLALLFLFTLSTPYTPPGSTIQLLLRVLILFLVIRLVILPLIRRNRH